MDDEELRLEPFVFQSLPKVVNGFCKLGDVEMCVASVIFGPRHECSVYSERSSGSMRTARLLSVHYVCLYSCIKIDCFSEP